MKHLSPELLAAAADGQSLAPAQRAHLSACKECKAEVAELNALMLAMHETPPVPAGLQGRTLQRIGLRPKDPKGFSWGWSWGAGFAAAGIALLLTLPSTQAPELVPFHTTPLAGPEKSSAAIPPDKPALAQVAVPTGPAAAEVKAAPAPNAPEEAWASAPAASLEAVGQVPTEPPQEQLQGRDEGSGPKATATPQVPALRVLSVRGNLLRPSMGERVVVELALGETGQTTALVLDSRGREVAVLLRSQSGPGPLQLSWDGQDAPSGAYCIYIKHGSQTEKIKTVVAR